MKKTVWSACFWVPRQGQKDQNWVLPVVKEALGEEFTSGWTFPRALLTWLLRDLAAWLLLKRLLREPAALAVCYGAAAAWDRLLAAQAAATEELLFPDRKIKIPGENMPILQKELFLVKSLYDRHLGGTLVHTRAQVGSELPRR